jgi:hypothetical protein
VVALVALAYGSYVHSLYGVHPFASASTFALKARSEIPRTWASHSLVGLAFLGGTVTTAAFVAPWLWSWRQIVSFGFAAAILAIALSFAAVDAYLLPTLDGARWQLIAHVAVFACLGLQIVSLTVRRLVRAPDADGFLLACWIAGIFVFAAFANWTTNVRSLVPALPAIAILLLGEARRVVTTQSAQWRLLVPLALGTAIALVVAHADYALARATRAAAEDLAAAAHSWNGPVRFVGTWGFQQYMESRGVRKLERHESWLGPATLLVLPALDVRPDPTTLVVVGTRQYPVSSIASTFSVERGSGFYTSRFGPVPFVFGRAPPEPYVLLKIVRAIPLHR